MAYYINDECISCGSCADVCPYGAPYEGDGKYEINPDLCQEAKECVAVCPVDAIHPIA